VRRQRGVTMIGWIFLLIPMAIVIYAGIRVGPVYYEYYKLISAMKSTASELKSDETLTQQSVRGALQRRFDTQYVDDVDASDIVVTKVDATWAMTAQYEQVIPLFGNLNLLMQFDETVPIQ
jgi:Flp pilus assembly protein TadG